MKIKTSLKETNGKDLLQGTDLDDLIYGANGKDSLFGFGGNDSLYGGNGRDVINGGDGADLIYGGRGDDHLTGGLGNDVFIFEHASGNDVITDFEIATPDQSSGLITFDDLEVTGEHGINAMPTEYAGVTWQNFYLMDSANYETLGTYIGDPLNYYHLESGYQNGTTSGQQVAFGSLNPTISGEDFTLRSVNLTGAWNDGITVYIFAFDDGAMTGLKRVTVNSDQPTLVQFDEPFFTSVDSVRFASIGGVNAGYGSYGGHLVFDDMNISLDEAPLPDKPASAGDLINLSEAHITDTNSDGLIDVNDLNIRQLGEDALVYIDEETSIRLSGVLAVELTQEHFIF